MLPKFPDRDDGLRVVAAFLALSFALPSPVLALRDSEAQEKKPEVLSGLEEALRGYSTTAPPAAISPRSAAGAEETAKLEEPVPFAKLSERIAALLWETVSEYQKGARPKADAVNPTFTGPGNFRILNFQLRDAMPETWAGQIAEAFEYVGIEPSEGKEWSIEIGRPVPLTLSVSDTGGTSGVTSLDLSVQVKVKPFSAAQRAPLKRHYFQLLQSELRLWDPSQTGPFVMAFSDDVAPRKKQFIYRTENHQVGLITINGEDLLIKAGGLPGDQLVISEGPDEAGGKRQLSIQWWKNAGASDKPEEIFWEDNRPDRPFIVGLDYDKSSGLLSLVVDGSRIAVGRQIPKLLIGTPLPTAPLNWSPKPLTLQVSATPSMIPRLEEVGNPLRFYLILQDGKTGDRFQKELFNWMLFFRPEQRKQRWVSLVPFKLVSGPHPFSKFQPGDAAVVQVFDASGQGLQFIEQVNPPNRAEAFPIVALSTSNPEILSRLERLKQEGRLLGYVTTIAETSQLLNSLEDHLSAAGAEESQIPVPQGVRAEIWEEIDRTDKLSIAGNYSDAISGIALLRANSKPFSPEEVFCLDFSEGQYRINLAIVRQDLQLLDAGIAQLETLRSSLILSPDLHPEASLDRVAFYSQISFALQTRGQVSGNQSDLQAAFYDVGRALGELKRGAPTPHQDEVKTRLLAQRAEIQRLLAAGAEEVRLYDGFTSQRTGAVAPDAWIAGKLVQSGQHRAVVTLPAATDLGITRIFIHPDLPGKGFPGAQGIPLPKDPAQAAQFLRNVRVSDTDLILLPLTVAPGSETSYRPAESKTPIVVIPASGLEEANSKVLAGLAFIAKNLKDQVLRVGLEEWTQQVWDRDRNNLSIQY